MAPDEDGNLNLTMDPVIRDYTGDLPVDEDANPVEDAQDPGKLEVVIYARNPLGRITHVAVCGTWVPLAIITTEATPGPTSDHVCYELAGWDFAEPFSSGFGEWTVAAVDRMAGAVCADQLFSLCTLSATRDLNFGGFTGTPAPDISAGTWANTNDPDGCGGRINSRTDSTGGAQRDTYRLVPDYPAGLTLDDPVVEMEFTITGNPGNLGVAAYDSNLDTYLPVVSHSKPSGASANQNTDHLQIFGGGQGAWRARFDTTGSAIADVEFVFYAVNNYSNTEDIEQIRYNVSGQVPGACFTWDDVDDVAAWMTSQDPFGAVWYLETATRICADVEVGTGAQYGALAGADDGPVSPTVT